MLKLDITPIFWILINNINKIEYSKVKETDEYRLVEECMSKHYIMMLHIDLEKNITIESTDLNEIFADLDLYYRTYDMYCDDHLSLKDAVIKIYKYHELEHSIDHLFDKFTF
jgi:hypothetical protein